MMSYLGNGAVPTVKRCVALTRARTWMRKIIEVVGYHTVVPVGSLAFPSMARAMWVRVTSSNSDHRPTTSTAVTTLAYRRPGITI